MKTRNYSFSMSVLYQTLRIVLMNCRNNMAAFVAFDNTFSDAMITGLESELLAAERIKSDQARTLEHETLRVEMLPLGEGCRDNWQQLKYFIKKAVGADLAISNWDAAGWQYYEESMNWDKLREMCSMASVYMEENNAALLAVGMAADFKDVFNELCASFNTKYDAFLIAQENAMQGTDLKIEANNEIFRKVSEISACGTVLFKRDEAKRNLFSMQAVSELVKPVGAAGLKGTVTQDGVPQAGLIVELENGNKHVMTDAEGAFDFGNQLASGTDVIIVRRGDEILAEDEVVINPGVTKREEVKLPIPTPPVAVMPA